MQSDDFGYGFRTLLGHTLGSCKNAACRSGPCLGFWLASATDKDNVTYDVIPPDRCVCGCPAYQHISQVRRFHS